MTTKLILAFAIIAVTLGCTSNQIARSYGGKTTIQIPKGEKVITATWKESNLWYLTRPMRNDEKPETFMLREVSNFGVMEGTVTLQESK